MKRTVQTIKLPDGRTTIKNLSQLEIEYNSLIDTISALKSEQNNSNSYIENLKKIIIH